MPLRTELGEVGVHLQDGREFVFSPSFASMARIGTPRDIVVTYSELYAQNPLQAAALVLHSCCNADCSDLTGWLEDRNGKLKWRQGRMPLAEMVILARHLMFHGVVGQRGESSGEYSPTFDPSEWVDSAMHHFKVTEEEAWQFTMSRFVRRLKLAYPDYEKQQEKVMTEAKYDAFIDRYRKMRAKQLEAAK